MINGIILGIGIYIGLTWFGLWYMKQRRKERVKAEVDKQMKIYLSAAEWQAIKK